MKTIFRNGKTPTITSFNDKNGVYLPNKINIDFIGVNVRIVRITKVNLRKNEAIYHFRGAGYKLKDTSKYSEKGSRLSTRNYMKHSDIDELLNNMLICMGFTTHNRNV